MPAPVAEIPHVAESEHYMVQVPRASISGELPYIAAPIVRTMGQESIDLTQAKPHTPDAKLMSVQQQVDETVVLMRENMQLALDRDEKVTNMEDKAEELQQQSYRFQKTSTKVKRRQWSNNIKWTIFLVLAILLLILVVILILQPWKW